ncbi:MAG: hypothetical protein ACXWUG_20920, partial [Polyangiales bacterium]
MTELPAPIPALVERAEALERARAAEHAEQVRIRSALRDQDLRVGGRAQIALLSLFPAFAVAMASYVATRHRTLGTRELLGAPAVIGVAFGVAYLAMRHRLRTSVSRRAIAALLLLPFSAFAHRLLGVHFGIPIPAMLAVDLVSAAIFALLLGLTLVRPIAWLAAPLFVGAVATVARPELAVPITVGSIVSTLSLLVLAWRTAVR